MASTSQAATHRKGEPETRWPPPPSLFSHRKDYNSVIYQPISTKFETQIQNETPTITNLKPEVQTGNKMAAAAIFAKRSNRHNSTIYQPISTKFEMRTQKGISPSPTTNRKCEPETRWPPPPSLFSHRKGYNSVIYQPISMKFETQVHNDTPILTNQKPEVLT